MILSSSSGAVPIPNKNNISVAFGGGKFIEATGGTTSTDGNYKVHKFTSSGIFEITANSGNVEYLVVAGGAGGGGGEADPPIETPQGKPIDIPADPPLEGGLETPQGKPITYFARAASGGQRQPYAMQQQQFPRKRRGFGGYPGGGVYGGGYGGGGYGGTYGIQQSS